MPFTPGPWVRCSWKETNPGIDTSNEEFCLSIIRMGDPEEGLGVFGRTEEEAESNAALIAAAPDLYEVVRRALAANVFEGPHLKGAAELAIAKANGSVSVAEDGS